MSKRFYCLIAALIVATLLLAACGGGGGQTGEQTQQTTVVSTPADVGGETQATATMADALQPAQDATEQPTEQVTDEATTATTDEATPEPTDAATGTPTDGTNGEADTGTPEAGETTDTGNLVGQATGGTIYVNDEFGFAIRIPAGWSLRELFLQGPAGTGPAGIIGTWAVMPPDVLQQLQIQTVAGVQSSGSTDSADATGTPDAGTGTGEATGTPGSDTTGTAEATGTPGTDASGTAEATGTAESTGTPAAGDTGGTTDSSGLTMSPAVAPFMVEVVQGDDETLQQAFPLNGRSDPQEAEFGGHTAQLITYDTGQVQVFFRHPVRDDITIVITDWVSQYPGREPQAEIASPQWQPFLQSLIFTDEAGMFDFTGIDLAGGTGMSGGTEVTEGNQDSTQDSATPEATATP